MCSSAVGVAFAARSIRSFDARGLPAEYGARRMRLPLSWNVPV